RIELPRGADQFFAAVARGVVGRGVIAHAIGDCLNDGGSFAAARTRESLVQDFTYGNDVVAVDLDTGNAAGDTLLRQGFAGGLFLTWQRDGPEIVDHQKDDGQLPDTGKIHRFVEVAFRGCAISERAYGDARLAAQLERGRNARGMRRLTGNGNSGREVLARDGVIAAALIAAP